MVPVKERRQRDMHSKLLCGSLFLCSRQNFFSRHHRIIDSCDKLHAKTLRDPQNHHPVLDGSTVKMVDGNVLRHREDKRMLVIWHLMEKI